YAFIMKDDCVASVQLRMIFPSGAASRGLGTHHFSIEPALLGWCKLSERWGIEGEFRSWTPVGGTDFAGEVLRYGIGIYHNLYLGEELRIAPVAEFVGWTVLAGKEGFPVPTGGAVTQDATGDTIVNAKIGVRFGFGTNSDLYLGYGRVLTGERWYENDFR